MSENKRKSDGRDNKRRRFRPDGTPIQSTTISGPGIWVTCVRGKERQAVGELYDLFEHLAEEMWPNGASGAGGGVDNDYKDEDEDGDEDEDEGDIEKQIAKEMKSMKRPRNERRFASCKTDTPCFVVISCKPPIDPVQLVAKHIGNIVSSGATQTRYAQRLTPVSATCTTNLPEIKGLCTQLLQPFLSAPADDGKPFTYKVELRTRNHNTLTRKQIVDELATCVPSEHKVNLDNPDVFILIEIFKSVCGIAVVRDYYRLKKFNLMEIAKAEEPGFKEGEGRLAGKAKASPSKPEGAESS